MKVLNCFIIILFFLTISVSGAELFSLEIYPRPVELSIGDSFELEVIGKDKEGRILPLIYPSWSVEPLELGRFTSINTIKTTFTAEKKGKGKIIVSCQETLIEQEIIIYDTLPPYNDIWPGR